MTEWRRLWLCVYFSLEMLRNSKNEVVEWKNDRILLCVLPHLQVLITLFLKFDRKWIFKEAKPAEQKLSCHICLNTVCGNSLSFFSHYYSAFHSCLSNYSIILLNTTKLCVCVPFIVFYNIFMILCWCDTTLLYNMRRYWISEHVNE